MDRKLTGMLISAAVVALLVLSVPMTGCLGDDDEGTVTITIAGSTTVQPIITQIAEAYMDANDNVDVQVSGGGSGQGVSQAGSGQVDIGMASRDVKASEMEDYPDLVVHDIAKDGIALIVNTDNEGFDALSVEEIRGVYNGTYTDWDELGGDAGEIVVVGRDSNSGTRDFFWEHVMDKEDFVAGMLEEASNGAVRGTVQTTPGAIGFVGLGYIDDSVKAVKVKMPAGEGTISVNPTVENVLEGLYPISRTLHLMTDGEPNEDIQDFIDYVLSAEGQAIVEDEGFVPMEASQHTAGTITISGSTTVLPIVTNAAEAYMDLYDDVDIQVSGGGSGTGVSQAGSGQVDIGMASRDVKASEMEDYPDLVVHDIASDGIALIVNTGNSVSDLTVEEVRGIYNGTYTDWDELGGDAGEIVVVGRDSNSGTREFFWKNVMDEDDFVAGMLEEASNGAVRGTVQTTPGAIGFVGLGYIDDTVKAVDIEVDGTPVTPSVSSVISGDYPISRTLHMLTDGEPTGLALEFIEFILSAEGQSIVEDEGFVPLQ